MIPFIISPPATFSWSYFKIYKPLDLLQGYGLHNTFLLYGMLPWYLSYTTTSLAISLLIASTIKNFGY